MKKELRRIFNIYKKKHNLVTKLIFDDYGGRNCFQTLTNKIYYDLYINSIINSSKLSDEVIVCPQNLKEFRTTKKGALTWILLHEIKHAIEYKKKIDFREKRADKFANKELKKLGWKNETK